MRKISVTLIELLIAIVILSAIVIGFYGIESFGRSQTQSADRRAQLQNELSYTLAHMTKQISRAIGNESLYGVNTVINKTDVGVVTTLLQVYIDDLVLGKKGIKDTTGDHWIAYEFSNNQISYYGNYPGTSEVVSSHIYSFWASLLTENYIDVIIVAHWNPTQPESADNPEVKMSSRIMMPAVSAR
jgi:type II secretory pathway pseudopilin PulG